MKRSLFAQAAVVSVLALASSAAVSTVIFDPVSGSGTVGKGDVQEAFLWNNKMLQDNAYTLVFQTVQKAQVTAVCTYEDEIRTSTGTGKNRVTTTTYVEKTKDSHYSANGTSLINSSTKNNPQSMVTGFILSGYKNFSPDDKGQVIPKVGDGCKVGVSAGIYTEVNVVGTGTQLWVKSSAGKALLANY